MLGYSKSIAAKLSAVPEIRAKALELAGLKAVPETDTPERKTYWSALLEASKVELIEILGNAMYDDSTQEQFDADILERQAIFGLDEESDAAISSLLRSERMREGEGS
jgi:hypothetical protein